MIKRVLLGPLVRLAAKWFDDAVPVERLHALLIRRLSDFHTRCTHGKENADPKIAAEVARARRLAVEAGVISSEDEATSSAEHEPAVTAEEIRQWVESVPDGRVVTSRRLVAGTGRWLDVIQHVAADQYADFLEANVEALLRHVEIRRTRCLQPLSGDASAEAGWLEKHDVAILFARWARRRRDLRMLNAAMKLNDWAFPSHCRLPFGARSVRCLLALAEQEAAAKELLS